jgi:hypothetical protein
MDMHAGCKPPRLENVVRQHLVKKAAESTRRYDVFHPSAWGYCLRKVAYQYYNENKKFYQKTDADVNSRLEMIFDNGHHVHARWQDYLDNAGVIRGIWRCPNPACGRKYGEGSRLGIFNPARTRKGWKCQCGNDKALEYDEIPIISHPDYNFRGSCDAVLDFRGGPFEMKTALDVIVVDFKSMKNDEFVKLEHAKPEHVVQVNIYMWVLGLKGAVLLYENKDKQLVKEMFVPRDEALITRIKKEAIWMRKLLNEGKLPPRNESFGRSSEPCLWCEFRGLCY